MPDRITYEFTSNGLRNNEALIVTDFRGSEAISKPYEYTISLKSENADIDMDEMLTKPCTFLMTVGQYQRPVHGCLSGFEQLHQADQFTMYRAVLVPRFWQLTLYKANEVYLKDLNDQDGTTVPDIIEIILKECGFTTLDYKMHLNGSYPRRQYRCQWNETHFQYISRLMEYEGICYYFDQDKASEKIVFCDNLNLHKDMKDAGVNYAPVSGVDIHTAAGNIRSLVCRTNRMPNTVVLQDYNYEKPSLDVTGTAVVDEKGVGEVFVYGDNFRTPEEGNRLAKIRAEEIFCTKERFHGEGMVSRMIPGYLFELRGHFRRSFNQKYLVTEIEHEGVAPSYLTERGRTLEEDTPAYANSFTAIPASVQFRPERVTPKSRFHGMINAVVDSRLGTSPYADVDDQGRYKTILPFDRETREQPGNASWWFRKAEPHAGPEEGMHFPLRRDTEVLLSFIDGDPDRPLISSAIANPRTPNVVDIENRSKNVFRTHSGNLFEMEDMKGSRRIKFETPHLSPTASRGTYMHLGAPNDAGDGLVVNTGGLIRMKADEAWYWDLATNEPNPPETGYTNTYCDNDGVEIPGVKAGDPAVHEKNFSYKSLNTKEEIKTEASSDRLGKQHVWNICGDRYTFRKGTDHNYGPDIEINYYNGYVENHVEGTFTETYDLPISKLSHTKGLMNDFWAKGAPKDSPVEKTWGNTYTYREGCSYEWANAKDFGFCGGYSEDYADDNDSAWSSMKHNEAGGQPFIAYAFGDSYDHSVGKSTDIKEGDVVDKMWGNVTEEMYGNTDSKTIGNVSDTMVGNTFEAAIGSTASFYIGPTAEFFLGIQFSLGVLAAIDIQIAAAADIFVGAKFEANIGPNLACRVGPDFELDLSGKVKIKPAFDAEVEVNKLKTQVNTIGTGLNEIGNMTLDLQNKVTEIENKPTTINVSMTSIRMSAMTIFL